MVPQSTEDQKRPKRSDQKDKSMHKLYTVRSGYKTINATLQRFEYKEGRFWEGHKPDSVYFKGLSFYP